MTKMLLVSKMKPVFRLCTSNRKQTRQNQIAAFQEDKFNTNRYFKYKYLYDIVFIGKSVGIRGEEVRGPLVLKKVNSFRKNETSAGIKKIQSIKTALIVIFRCSKFFHTLTIIKKVKET